MAEEAPIQSTTSTVSAILPYQCWACDKRFSCQSQMKNHEVVHSDEKPFVCEVCNRGFRRKDCCKILLNFGSIICWTSYISLVTDIFTTEKSTIWSVTSNWFTRFKPRRNRAPTHLVEMRTTIVASWRKFSSAKFAKNSFPALLTYEITKSSTLRSAHSNVSFVTKLGYFSGWRTSQG